MKEKEEEEEEDDDDASSPLKSEIAKLRRRWELASVLNFFNVFEPVIGNDSLLSAEEIETGLVKPNESLAKLHIMLLKGIPPVSKLLNRSDGWVTVLCKKLALWWPWVAEGEIPLIASRGGDEISKYKDELDPVHRLLLLRALCEVRADQVDALSFINSEMKKGGAHRVSSFRKDKIGGDGSTSYWCDGNAVLGHRLYREVTVSKRNSAKAKARGKACKATSSTSQWETLATNLQEFHQAVAELSSSRRKAEASVCNKIEADVLPEMEKLQKKKDRALKRKQTQEKLLNDVRAYTTTGLTRSCRNRRLISYTFDEYDRAIDEAIKQQPKKRKMVKEQKTITMERVEQATSPNSGTEESGADTESKGTDDHDDQGNSSSDDDGSGSSGQKEVGDDEEEDDDGDDDGDGAEEEEEEEDDDGGGDDNEADSETQKNDENGNEEHSEKSSEADNDENDSVDDDTSGGDDDDQNQVDSSSKSKSVEETQDTGDKE